MLGLIFVNEDRREVCKVPVPTRVPGIGEVVLLDSSMFGRSRYQVVAVESIYGDSDSHSSSAAKAMGGPFDAWESEVTVVLRDLTPRDGTG